jgi:putative ubiquitin-RnfH superfamily antitoxin RatB of RatAB toxin-antitoxin module
MAADAPISIEVVYALPAEQAVVSLEVPAGTTLEAAVALSGLRVRYPEIPDDARLGIHGRVTARDTVLREGDRVEIYRPLVADPKTARRRRAARAV